MRAYKMNNIEINARRGEKCRSRRRRRGSIFMCVWVSGTPLNACERVRGALRLRARRVRR